MVDSLEKLGPPPSLDTEPRYKDFIGVYPNAVDHELCDAIVRWADEWLTKGLFSERENDAQGRNQADQSLVVGGASDADRALATQEFLLEEFRLPLEQALMSTWELYKKMYWPARVVSLALPYHKIQITEPIQGYHVWHYEAEGEQFMHRVAAYTLYLNDVEEGGETEFLYQSLRVRAKKGTVVWFPAGYTHPHRGNPPLSGSKYITTGWLTHK